MHAVAAVSFQKKPWVPLLSVVLLIFFLLVSFANLSIHHENSAHDEIPLAFSSRTQAQPLGNPIHMLNGLRGEPEHRVLRTHSQETPYWVYASVSQEMTQHFDQIFFRTRHVSHSSCWLDLGDEELQELRLEAMQDRFMFASLAGQDTMQGVLCQFKFTGISNLEVGLQSQNDLSSSVLSSERRQSFLEGVLYLMIGLVAMVAFMTRSLLLVGFGFWIFASLRLVALTEGWDHIVAGVELKTELLMRARMFALALYFTSTLLMVWHLFENFRRIAWLGVLRALQCASVILFVLAIYSPYTIFLELFLPLSLVGSCVLAWVILENFLEKKNRIQFYCLGAMLISIVGAVAEAGSIWFHQRILLQYFNSASATVLTSLLIALALAEYFRKAVPQEIRCLFPQSGAPHTVQSFSPRQLDAQQLPEGLTLAWQPIVALNHENTLIYAEALLRIKGRDQQLHSANFLLEACEQSGRTEILDSWVLRNTLNFLSEHADHLGNLGSLSINISPGSLNNGDFLDNTLALIRTYPQQASKLCIEITEVGLLINLQAIQNFIAHVQALGVRIALDDFGAGHSNFRYAMDLHADVIKIDGSIVSNICNSTECHAVTSAIVGLAHRLGCECAAEWVEDFHTLRELKKLGVDYVQGFLVLPALECERFLDLNSTFELMPDQANARMIQDILELVPD